MTFQIDTNGTIADFLNIALTAVRNARGIAQAAGDDSAVGLFLLSQNVAGAIAHHAGKAVEHVTGKPSDELSPFEAEVMMVVQQHGKITKSAPGTMSAYALNSLVKRRLLVPANVEGSEFIVPRYLPLGENGAAVMVSRGTAAMYDTIMNGQVYTVTSNPHVRDSVIKQCWRLVDAGIAKWVDEGTTGIVKADAGPSAGCNASL